MEDIALTGVDVTPGRFLLYSDEVLIPGEVMKMTLIQMDGHHWLCAGSIVSRGYSVW